MAGRFFTSLAAIAVTLQSTRGGFILSNGSRTVFEGKIVTLTLEEARLPDGKVRLHEVVRHPGGAAVVGVDGEGCVFLLRQWRHAGGGWLWELPAGKLDVKGETPLDTAVREFREEAGMEAASWEPLGSMISTPGFSDEVIHLFLARGLKKSETDHGDGEVIEIHRVPFGDALAMALSGEIADAKTIAGLFRAAPRVGGGWG